MIGSGKPDTPVKIGIAANLKKRLQALQGGNHERLKVLASFAITDDIARLAEGACHDVLGKKRLHGEWFSASAGEASEVAQRVINLRLWGERHSLANGAILHMNVPADLKRALDEIAKEDRRSLTITVVMALESFVAKRRPLTASPPPADRDG